MQRKVLLVGSALVLILIIAAGAFFVQKKSKVSQEKVVDAVESESMIGVEQSGTFGSLLGLNKNLSCEASYVSDAGETSGTVYVSASSMRGDFKAPIEDGKQIESHMISDGVYMYSWTSGGGQGVKMKLDAAKVSPSPAASPIEEAKGPGLDQEVKYKCSPWNVDESKFVPPGDIQFMDLSEMMKPPVQTQSQPAQTSGKTDVSQCDQFTDPTVKAACVAAVSGQ